MTLPEKQFVTVNGAQMAYVESGDGEPIVLVHGNPTSPYLWRNPAAISFRKAPAPRSAARSRPGSIGCNSARHEMVLAVGVAGTVVLQVD